MHTIPLFITKHLNELGIGPAKLEDHIELLKHWKSRIVTSLNIKLSPDMEDVTMDQ